MKLDDSLNINDLGTSAYRGKNVVEGGLFCGPRGATMRRKGASRNDIFIFLRCFANCGAKSCKYDVLYVLFIDSIEHDLIPHLDNRGAERAKLLRKIAEADQVVRTMAKASRNLLTP